MDRPTFEECLEIIRDGPDKGVLATALAGGFNVVYPADFDGPVPLPDEAEVTLIFGVPFPSEYAKKVIEPKALPQLMNEFVKGYLTECEDCGQLPCLLCSDDAEEMFCDLDLVLLSEEANDIAGLDRSEVIKKIAADQLKATRFKAYKRWSFVVNGVLGKGRRVPLPNCITKKIKELWPDPEEEYVGFRASPVDDNGHN